MEHVISFRRPRQKHVLTKMTIPPQEDAAAYIRRLEDLGYKVVEIVPPINHQGPPQRPRPLVPDAMGGNEAAGSLPK